MRIDKRLEAIIYLLEDNDEGVFKEAEKALYAYGIDVLPSLEYVYNQSENLIIKERLGIIMQDFRFKEIFNDFQNWSRKENPNLIEASFLISRWMDNSIEKERFYTIFNQIKINVWLEVNNTLTAFEQIYLINSIFYNYYNFKLFPEGGFLSYNPFHLMLEGVGNKYSLALLYIAICETLDIPIFVLNIPDLLLMGYFDNLLHFYQKDGEKNIQIAHYIDPEDGVIHGKEEVLFYIRQFMQMRNLPQIKPMNNKQFIKLFFESMLNDESLKNDQSFSKMTHQLQRLIFVLNENL
ncbi:MAG TPA: transglutaminase family protein [Chitinophagaceae bacterium]|nr:transglutaminase family protein [Chitinophagaceae bacterium]